GSDSPALARTSRPRPDGLTLAQTVAAVRERFDGPLMADCDSVESALLAADLGIEIIGTTLSGYTAARPAVDGPDLELLGELAGALTSTSVLVAAGRVHSTAQAAAARAAGAHAVGVGTAITRPTRLTRWFHDAVTSAPRP